MPSSLMTLLPVKLLLHQLMVSLEQPMTRHTHACCRTCWLCPTSPFPCACIVSWRMQLGAGHTFDVLM
jgi:hypothetical protein